MNKANKLIVEYIVTYGQKSLIFNFYENKRLLGSYLYEFTGEDDSKNIKTVYDFLSNEKNFKSDKCDLVISSFDVGVTDIKLPKKIFMDKGVIDNFLYDYFESDYDKNYYILQNKFDIDKNSSLFTFYSCPIKRINEVESIFTTLGFKKFAVTFINKCFNNFLKSNPDANKDYFSIHETEWYYLLANVINNNIVSCYLICKEDKVIVFNSFIFASSINIKYFS